MSTAHQMNFPSDHAYSAGWRQGAGAEPGGRMVTTDGRALPMQGARLYADARAGQCRVVLEQVFVNLYQEPLEVRYKLPLPADGAVSGFAFTIGGRRIVGQIDRKQVARARYQRALAEGRSAALLEQERSSLFTQQVGNIPPGAVVVAEVTIDQPLHWVEGPGFGGWEWRFPTVVGPRFMGGGQGRVRDAKRVSVAVADRPLPTGVSLELQVRDAVVAGARALPSSPSHHLDVRREGATLRVGLAEGSAALDRDVVIRWAVARPRPGVELDLGRAPAGHAWDTSAFGVLTLIPPGEGYQGMSLPRDIIILLDTSGSMHGEPLDQAKRVATALIESLESQDRVELIEFSSRVNRFRREPILIGHRSARQDAIRWIKGLRASGGTYMRDGIIAALRPLEWTRMRQVVLITDGLIGFEDEIVAAVKRRAAQTRVHTVGIGSGVNRSLTRPVAREGAGVEIILAPGQDVEPGLRTLLRRTARPCVVDLHIEGAAGLAPERLPDLYGGSPAKISVCLDPRGGCLVLRGRTAEGPWSQRLEYGPIEPGAGNQAAPVLYAREWVEDLEARILAGEPAQQLDAEIERVGLQFSIATRKTSWIAVSSYQEVDRRAPRRQIEQPHELPAGMSASLLGLRPVSPAPQPRRVATLGGFARPASAGRSPAPRARPAGRAVRPAMRPSAKPAAPRRPAPTPARAPAPPPAAPPPPAPEPKPFDGFAVSEFSDEDLAELSRDTASASSTGATFSEISDENINELFGDEQEADDDFEDGGFASAAPEPASTTERVNYSYDDAFSVRGMRVKYSIDASKQEQEEEEGADLESLAGAPSRQDAPEDDVATSALPSFAGSSLDAGPMAPPAPGESDRMSARVPDEPEPRGGLFSRLRGLFGRKGAQRPTLHLTARLVRESVDELVFSITVPRGVRWAPEDSATLLLSNRQTMYAEIVGGTTPAGMVSGERVTLQLRWTGSLDKVIEIRFTDDSGQRVIITIE